MVAAVFLLLLGSIGAGTAGLLGYKVSLEREARQFADVAFRRIFAEHDTYFMLDHASERLLRNGRGRDGLTRFMQQAMIRGGDVYDIEPAVGSLRFSFSFPSHLGTEGEMIAKGKGIHGRSVRMHMIVAEAGSAWTIHAIRWTYL